MIIHLEAIMFLIKIFKENPYTLYREFCDDKLFNNWIELIEHLITCFKKSQNEIEDDAEQKEIHTFLVSLDQKFNSDKVRLQTPFCLTPQREAFIRKIQTKHKLSEEQTDALRASIFNFSIRSYLEDGFVLGLIKPLLLNMNSINEKLEQHLKLFEENLERTKKSLPDDLHFSEKLSQLHQKQRQEQYDLIYAQSPSFRLAREEGFDDLTTEYFPEISKKGRPETQAYNFFIWELYTIVESNLNYMPFMQDVLYGFQEIRPSFFKRVELTDTAIRKRIKNLKSNNKACT